MLQHCYHLLCLQAIDYLAWNSSFPDQYTKFAVGATDCPGLREVMGVRNAHDKPLWPPKYGVKGMVLEGQVFIAEKLQANKVFGLD